MSELEETPKEKMVALTPVSLTAGSPVLGTPILISPEETAEFIEQKLRPRFEGGDNRALLEAVDICARARIPMAAWVAEAFSSRFAAWRRFDIRTLDDAFQVSRRKNTRLDDRARQEQLKWDVLNRVCALRKEGHPLDVELFETVGSEFGMSGSWANKIYYQGENREDREYALMLHGLTVT